MKQLADAHGLMVMGPDCGTAIVNGVPLGFANVVRRGPIGVVGASGTGMQEVTARVHNLGSGVSQALGTGGHDLSDAHRRHLDAARAAAARRRPRHRGRRARVQAARPNGWPRPCSTQARRDEHPGRRDLPRRRPGGRSATTRSVASAPSPTPPTWRWPSAAGQPAPDLERQSVTPRRGRSSTTRRAGWRPASATCAGSSPAGRSASRRSCCCQAAGIIELRPTPRWRATRRCRTSATSREHTIVDMGDDEFTQGRPHPMIDPTLRDERIAAEAADPTTAVVLFDVVLGYGSAADPVAGLLARARRRPLRPPRAPGVTSRSSPTSAAPTPTRRTAPAPSPPRSTGAFVASSNAEAARGPPTSSNRAAARVKE